MLGASLMTTSVGGPAPLFMIAFYRAGEIVPFVVAAGAFVFLYIAKLARQKADNPLLRAWAALRPRLSLWPLPLFAFPVFLGSFTATKSAIPVIVGYHSDALLAVLDHSIFGTDPWRVTHYFIRGHGTLVIQFIYVAVWVPLLAGVVAALPFFASRATVARFYTAMFSTWIVGGFVLAYLFSSVGPIFAHLVDPTLGAQFAPLQSDLSSLLSPKSVLMTGQAYLENGFRTNAAAPGAGISAMPSMHVAMATLYVLGARRTWLLWPAVAFLLVIVVGSVHSGFHYFIDAPVAIGIAMLCWAVAGRRHQKLPGADLDKVQRGDEFDEPALGGVD
jgi:hypothetical protein